MVREAPSGLDFADNVGFWMTCLGRSFTTESLLPTISFVRSSLRVGGVPHLLL